MGCLARLGCLALLVAGGIAAYLTRDRWLHHAPAPSVAAGTTVASDWSPLNAAGADRARDALTKLSSRNGPVFVTLGGSDVASYIFLQIAKQLPASTDSFAARIKDDQVALHAIVKVNELGKSALGLIGALFGDREPVDMSGTLRVIGPGVAEFRVSEAKIHDVELPDAVIARLIAPLVKGQRPKGLDDNALPISIPSYIGDVRVANGKITLYKNVQ